MNIWTLVATCLAACALAFLFGAFLNAGLDITNWPRDSRLGVILTQHALWAGLLIVADNRKSS